MTHFKSLDYVKNSYNARICQMTEERKTGKKVVGTLCLFVPDEIILAAGADRVILCGGKNDTVSIAEQYLPRNICPLVKSSFGSIINDGCSGVRSCSHFDLVDMVVAENTCDSKKKMYELLENYVPTYVLDLPQRPDSPEAIKYFLEELNKFKSVMERLTGNKVTVEQLKKEITSLNETRQLLHRLYDLRKVDPPLISGLDVLKVMQKQYFLSTDELKKSLCMLIDEAEQVETDWAHKPRIMISGCPMAGGNTKVPEIIESKGGVIVAEESCTGTRSFWELVDEDKDPMLALAERYIRIPCSCMTPNDRRIDNILELAREFKVDGVVCYTLQFCHGYNIERYKVQQALKKAGIPMLSIETDYGDSDVEQIGLRVDAFMEMLS
ncbi:double-cubane-cluster-containing anaerobic reductase [Methanosarcina sp. Z-7115]|uniref:Double-cubane-cluster-containing anaerobic reductase n=1 Tax=Methanosarcina baikalica TaxID=3073890 RepID=A0ABU2D1K2_9EURY|nr:double-cubane-cluster-containing anaerobic reductase [Methanosarcina sp. Z-7115]MDR7665860.1 double-cubane-cluster-containing anaerobic reductase [Methanosarcina sp. Z-7115]